MFEHIILNHGKNTYPDHGIKVEGKILLPTLIDLEEWNENEFFYFKNLHSSTLSIGYGGEGGQNL